MLLVVFFFAVALAWALLPQAHAAHQFVPVETAGYE